MYHSIQIGSKNTYDDWHLLSTSRPVVAAPQPKLIFEEVPGSSNTIDLSESLTGAVEYYDRSGSFEFIVENDYVSWELLYSEIMTYLQGRTFKMILEDDPNYYYEGRFAVNEWRSEKDWSKIVIDYRLKPFKYEIVSTGLVEIELSDEQYFDLVHIDDIYVPTVPVITAENAVSQMAYIAHGAVQGTYELPAGSSSPVRLIGLGADNQNTLLFYGGSGKITIAYNKGRL